MSVWIFDLFDPLVDVKETAEDICLDWVLSTINLGRTFNLPSCPCTSLQAAADLRFFPNSFGYSHCYLNNKIETIDEFSAAQVTMLFYAMHSSSFSNTLFRLCQSISKHENINQI